MLFACILIAAIGVVFLALGWVLWKKQKITLLHDYHYQNVRKDDVPAYTRAMGIGLILIGAGICVTGIVNLILGNARGWIAFGIGFLLGLAVMHRAQKKYNGSWFS